MPASQEPWSRLLIHHHDSHSLNTINAQLCNENNVVAFLWFISLEPPFIVLYMSFAGLHMFSSLTVPDLQTFRKSSTPIVHVLWEEQAGAYKGQVYCFSMEWWSTFLLNHKSATVLCAACSRNKIKIALVTNKNFVYSIPSNYAWLAVSVVPAWLALGIIPPISMTFRFPTIS